MKVIFNITENKNKATFEQEVVKINTSFNQTENVVKPKFQIGYYPLPVNLENYYTKNETNLLLLNYYLKTETYSQNEINDFLDLKADLSELNNYYTKIEINSQFLNYYTKTEVDLALATKQANLGYTPENVANKSDSYTVSSSTTYSSTKALVDGLATKLDKGTYTGNADDILNEISEEASFRYDADTELNDAINLAFAQITQKQKKVPVITITGNTTLSETHNGAVLNVTNTCNITIPTGLDVNFQCVIFAKGSIIVTFVSSGVTIYAPSGLLLKQDKMASLICTATNNFNLTGELATS